MTNILWRPRLFAALGAGFENDPTVQDGVHLRWSLDPRLGLPFLPINKGFEIAFSRTAEGTIAKVDLFKPNSAYPVRSNKMNLPAGPGILHRDADEISFLRTIVPQNWTPHWVYTHRRAQVAAQTMDLPEDDWRLLGYIDGLIDELSPESPVSSTVREDAVAVDIKFSMPQRPGGGGIIGPIGPIGPFESLGATAGSVSLARGISLSGSFGAHLPSTPGVSASISDLFDRPVLEERFGVFNNFGPQVFLTVQGFDHCGRLVAEDWVGRHSRILGFPSSGPFAAQSGALKLVARLRAAGIRTVRIRPRTGQPILTEEEVRWVFCDEYAAESKIWLKVGEEVLDTDASQYTPDWLRDDIHLPFHGASQPLDWVDMAKRLKDRFLNAPEVQGVFGASDTFAMWDHGAKISDQANPTNSSDDSLTLPVLTALYSGAVDPVLARLLGLYGHVPKNPDIGTRDWRITVRPPFGAGNNLQKLDDRLRGILNPGIPFFHTAGDSMTDFSMVSLVLNASEGIKPPPPKPNPAVDADVQLVPAKPDQFNNLVSATIFAAPVSVETEPYRVNASYEVIRSLTGEPAANVLAAGKTGPLDDIGILPDVLVPEFDTETCVSTGELRDIFSRDASTDRQLEYLVRGFDIFGRPSDPAKGQAIDIPAACLAPPAPDGVTALATRQNDVLSMTVDFELGEFARSVEADWQALEILIHKVPLIEGLAPEDTTWSGSRAGRLIEAGFDPNTLALRTLPLQQSCLRLSWTFAELERQLDAETLCSANFPVQASVTPKAGAIVGEAGRKAYRLSLGLGSRGQYPDGLNAWCAHLRVRGRCPKSGKILHSSEVTVRATLMLPPRPPQVVQPPVVKLPLSTYPDAQGDSFYNINLRDILSPADQTASTLVRTYLARIEALTDTPEDFVDGENITDLTGLFALARQSRGRFGLISDPPEAFDPAAPHTSIPVPGEVAQTYVAAVLGANGLLETGNWQGAAFLPFRTPPLRPLPLVDWISAGIAPDGAGLRAELSLNALFSATMPNPMEPPLLQLFRRDLSAGQTQSQFVTTVLGQTEDPNAVKPEYLFRFEDGAVNDWRRYEYSVQLLEFAPGRGQHVKIGTRLKRLMGAPSTGSRDLFAGADDLQVSVANGIGFRIETDLAPGDFTIELQKVPDQGTAALHVCRIEAGQLFLPDTVDGTLRTGEVCALSLTDADNAPGLYRLRIRFGQSMADSKETRTP